MAEHTAIVEPDARPLRPDAPVRYNVRFQGEIIVTRARDPEHEACRALAARGIKGRITFAHASGATGLTLDIETGAGLTVRESTRDGRPRLRKWTPWRSRGPSQAAIQAAPDNTTYLPENEEPAQHERRRAASNRSLAD